MATTRRPDLDTLRQEMQRLIDQRDLVSRDREPEVGKSLARDPLNERADTLEHAVVHCQQVLTVYSQEAFPVAYQLSWASAGTFLAGVSRLLLVLAVVVPFLIPISALAAQQPEVAAKYAVVVDAKSGKVLYDKGMKTPTAPASLTKVFTAVVALDSASLDQKLTTDQYDLVGGTSMGLQADQSVTLRTLLYGLLLVSGNDAAMTIARNVGALADDSPQQSINRFMKRVNTLSERLGLTGTYLLNPHGLDQAGHQSTARDLAVITRYALKNNDFRTIIGTASYNHEGFQLYQANMLLGDYPGLIGGKTGYTESAGYCLIEVAERDGHTIIAVLLNSTENDWYQDARTLLDYGFENISAPADAPLKERRLL